MSPSVENRLLDVLYKVMARIENELQYTGDASRYTRSALIELSCFLQTSGYKSFTDAIRSNTHVVEDAATAAFNGGAVLLALELRRLNPFLIADHENKKHGTRRSPGSFDT